jgi:hypothetical protein
LLLSTVPSTAQKPVWFSSIKILILFDVELALEDAMDAAIDEREEDGIDEGVDDLTEEAIDDGATDDFAELAGIELGAKELDATAPPQILPVSCGISAAPLVSTCTPNTALWLGCKLPFQATLVAV